MLNQVQMTYLEIKNVYLVSSDINVRSCVHYIV